MNIIAAAYVGDTITFTPTITSGLAYAANQRFGSIIELPNVFPQFARIKPTVGVPFNSQHLRHPGTLHIQSVHVVDQAAQSQPYRLWFFDALPTVASADRAALNIVDGESSKSIANIDCDATYGSATAWTAQTKGNLGVVIKQSNVSQSLWVVIQILGAGTFSTTTDVTFKMSIYQD